jgi:hypothetical protein
MTDQASGPQGDDEPALDIAHGNRQLARHLRAALELLRDQADDEDFRHLADDVLAGRASLRDVYFTPAFAAGIDQGVEQFAQRFDQLSREERDQLVEQGKRLLSDD